MGHWFPQDAGGGLFPKRQSGIPAAKLRLVRLRVATAEAVPSELANGAGSVASHLKASLWAGFTEQFNQCPLRFGTCVWRLCLHAVGSLNFGVWLMNRTGFW